MLTEYVEDAKGRGVVAARGREYAPAGDGEDGASPEPCAVQSPLQEALLASPRPPFGLQYAQGEAPGLGREELRRQDLRDEPDALCLTRARLLALEQHVERVLEAHESREP